MTDQLSSDLASLRIDPSAPRQSSPSSVRRFVVPAVLIGVIGVVGWVLGHRLQGQVFKQEMRTTEISMISPSQAEVQVTASGYVIPQQVSKVGARSPGRLSKVLVKEGDTVKAGDTIAVLEDNVERSAVTAAKSRAGAAGARITTARANLAEISQQVERERALVAAGAVGRANLDSLVARETAMRGSVRAAEAEAAVAHADIGTVNVNLKDSIVVAPIGGRIVTKPATVGEFVGGVGNPLPIAEIVDFASQMVEADVPEARLHLVKVGSPCEIVLDAYPNKRYRGVAAELGNRVNRSKGTIMVKVKFVDDIDGVLPEMSARVSFLAKAITDAALKDAPKKVVTAESVVERDRQKVVFTVDDGKLHAYPVKVGGAVGSSVELLDGPPPGTKVVAKPTPETADGQRIKETDK